MLNAASVKVGSKRPYGGAAGSAPSLVGQHVTSRPKAALEPGLGMLQPQSALPPFTAGAMLEAS